MELFDSLAAIRKKGRKRLARWLPLLLVALAACMLLAFGANLFRMRTRLLELLGLIPIFLVVGFVFGLLPILICLVQTFTRRRLANKLESVESYPVAHTLHFVCARAAVDLIRPATIMNVDYVAPLLVLFLMNACGFALICAVYADPSGFVPPSVILGGMRILAGTTDLVRQDYQVGTFVVIAAAFLGSYLYMIGRLIERLGNNDLYPLSLYVYVVRAVTAVIVAAIFRHTAFTLGLDPASSVLVLIGFIAGVAPDMVLLAMVRRAGQYLKVMGSKKDPDKAALPSALPLIMIDDLTREKVDRLSEVGVDTAQALACQNPFTIWLRLPEDLGLVVQWIAAAQLYTLVKEKTLLKLRELAILTVFDLRCRLDDAESAVQICEKIGLPATSADALKAQLDGDPCFVRLKQVRDAMTELAVPQARGAAPVWTPPLVHAA